MNIEAIILAKSCDLNHYGLTCRTINSLKNSSLWEGKISIVESETELTFKQNGFSYHGCDTIFPEEKFNYNRFLNIGIKNLKEETDWILICNNDLFFTSSWYLKMLESIELNPSVLSFSPKCPNWHIHKDVGEEGILKGHQVSKNICGWCILFHRSLVEKCGLFDEQFEFWYQDNDYSQTLQHFGIEHALACSSKVYHMVSGTHDVLGERTDELTDGQMMKFLNKWKK